MKYIIFILLKKTVIYINVQLTFKCTLLICNLKNIYNKRKNIIRLIKKTRFALLSQKLAISKYIKPTEVNAILKINYIFKSCSS